RRRQAGDNRKEWNEESHQGSQLVRAWSIRLNVEQYSRRASPLRRAGPFGEDHVGVALGHLRDEALQLLLAAAILGVGLAGQGADVHEDVVAAAVGTGVDAEQHPLDTVGRPLR